MKRTPGMWLCQVCGSEEGWPDGRLSGDVLCQDCAEWAIVPRLFMAIERNDAAVMVEVIEVVDKPHPSPHVTLRGVH